MIVTIRQSGERDFCHLLCLALTPHVVVEESSSENAAMVLKIRETSQGNVCPVDIWLHLDALLNFYNNLRLFARPQTGEARTADLSDLLENSHLCACKARADKGPNAVIARWSSTKSC